MKYSIPLFSLPALLLMAMAGCLHAADAPAHIDIQKLPGSATLVNDVVVPVPSEIFGVLDKLGSPNWHDVLRTGTPSIPSDRPQTALLLGTVIAEGFIAVEAHDGEAVKKIGRNVLTLSAAIGVKKSVIARSNAIIEAADKKDWDDARQELDKALHDVKQAMTELHDEQLAQLVSLGGWLRGTEALCEVVQGGFNKDGAQLLHQPLMLEYFQKQLSGMDPRLTKKNAVVKEIQARLGDIGPLITGTDITAKDVEGVHAIARELVKSISSD